MTLYASSLMLDRSAIKAQKITDLYSLHRVIYDLFSDIRNDQEKLLSVPSGIQWVDKGGDYFGRQILILSDRPPLTRTREVHGHVVTKLLPQHFLSHTHYQFEIVICPTRRDNKTKKLIPVKGSENIANWFIERASASWGFSVDVVSLQVERVAVCQFNNKHGHIVTLQQAKLTGCLTVINNEQFQKSFHNGIGRGRSFGCGLLQIIPVTVQSIFDKE
jgi:CRISPR system Cascade subunit CasE